MVATLTDSGTEEASGVKGVVGTEMGLGMRTAVEACSGVGERVKRVLETGHEQSGDYLGSWCASTPGGKESCEGRNQIARSRATPPVKYPLNCTTETPQPAPPFVKYYWAVPWR